MEYTLTRIDKNAQRYPMEQRSKVPDPIEEQLSKNIFLGKLEDVMHGVVNWGRKNSIWPYNFGLSCCYVEMATAFTPTHDLARFGAEVIRASPRQADLMVIAGTCFMKMAPVVQRLYEQMLEPKWVISMGACATPAACTTSIRWCRASTSSCRSTSMCRLPAAPEAFLQGLNLLQDAIGKERRPLSWVVGDQGVYKADPSRRETLRPERSAQTTLRTPDQV